MRKELTERVSTIQMTKLSTHLCWSSALNFSDVKNNGGEIL